RLEGDPLVDRGFAFGMIAQHEQQHDETMLATHQLRVGEPVLSAPPPPAARVRVAGEVLIPAGPFTMGTSTEPWALDNERPAHRVDLPAYYIDAAPVTNGQYAEFIADGGYDDPRWWTPEGWRHRVTAGLAAPMHWRRDGDRWYYTRFGRTSPVAPDEPVVHVCFHEAQAYAAWAGKRLPTEAEWEKAARFDPASGRSRRYPWGDEDPTPRHANLGQRHLSPAPVGAYPDGASPLGVHQLIGDVWEWVDTDFHGYPGFVAFPYREYSEVFFGTDYKVLRGGSFGTDPVACRGTFRNWDFPIRRQIFAGFRCARDPRPGEEVDWAGVPPPGLPGSTGTAGAAAVRRAARPGAAVVGAARHARERHRQRRRVRGRLVPATGRAPRPLPAGPTHVERSGPAGAGRRQIGRASGRVRGWTDHTTRPN